MSEISGAIDVHAVVGAVVVFALIGAAIFGVYYFVFAGPAAAELEQTKTAAMSELSQTLGSVGTEQAAQEFSNFSSQIQAAGSTGEVSSIQAKAAAVYQRESKREELLDKVDTATIGVYHSTADVPALATLSVSLKAEINAKTTLTELQSYEASGTIDTQATSTWQSYLTGVVEGIGKENVVMKRHNSPTYWEYMSKDNALSLVGGSIWSDLREMDFEGTTYVNVPIASTFDLTPTIKVGTKVNIYAYDTVTDNMSSLFGNATVDYVIYSSSDLGVINWSMTDGETTYSYSNDIWAAIMAAAAGDSEAATVDWQNYVSDVIDRALSAGVGDFTASVIYVVEVTDEAGMLIMEYQEYSATMDILLIARV